MGFKYSRIPPHKHNPASIKWDLDLFDPSEIIFWLQDCRYRIIPVYRASVACSGCKLYFRQSGPVELIIHLVKRFFVFKRSICFKCSVRNICPFFPGKLPCFILTDCFDYRVSKSKEELRIASAVYIHLFARLHLF